MTNVVKLHVDLSNPGADRLAIHQCAEFCRRRVADTQAADAFISCGERLATLKRGLVKSTPRGDNQRIGWLQAFELRSEFPFGRSYADKLIAIWKFFNGRTANTKNLPADSTALYLLASKFKTEQVMAACADGSITAGTTRAEIIALGKRLKVIKPAKKKSKLEDAPKSQRIAAVKKLMTKLKLTWEDVRG